MQTFYQKYWKNQLSKLGLRFRQEQIEGEKQFYLGEDQENSAQPQTVFDGQLQTLTYTQVLPYLEQELSSGSLSTQAKLGWSLNLYPELGQTQSAQKSMLEWSLGMTYPLNDENDFSLSFTQTTSAFPLRRCGYSCMRDHLPPYNFIQQLDRNHIGRFYAIQTQTP